MFVSGTPFVRVTSSPPGTLGAYARSTADGLPLVVCAREAISTFNPTNTFDGQLGDAFQLLRERLDLRRVARWPGCGDKFPTLAPANRQVR